MSNSIATRLIALLSLCSALILGLGMLVDYHLSRDEILNRLQAESQETIRSAIIDMENWLDGVEGSTLFLARILEQRNYTRAGLEQMLKDIVENNGDIYGATIALNPELVESPLGFAPYYYHRQGILSFVDLATEDYNYQQQAWFQDAINAGKPIWVEPYYDRGGGEILMTTFAVPVFRVDARGQRSLYAVVTADVALDELRSYLRRLRLGESGFATLMSRTGIIISGRDPSNHMLHYSEALADQQDLNQLKTAAIGLITLLMMGIAVYLVTRRLTRPLTALALASGNIARGQLDTVLPSVRGDDEIARLVNSFRNMKDDLKTYIADLKSATASRGRLEGELAAAREIQMSLLPGGGEVFEQQQQYQLWACVRPAKSVGGDLYSYHLLHERLFIAVGDVSDKGVPAALFMAKAISLLQQLIAAGEQPQHAMAKLNNVLETGNDNCMFVTLFLGVLDLNTLQLQFSSAGHPPPSLLRDASVQIVHQEDGPALGLASDQEFPLNSIELQPADRLAIYTDGIDEAFNEQAQMFGIERFNVQLTASANIPIDQAGPQVFQLVDDFAGDTPQSDDITLMLLQLPGRAQLATEISAATGAQQSFPAGADLASRIMQWLQDTLQELPVSMETEMELILVTEEIVTNIDKYAELPDNSLIRVKLDCQGEQYSLEFSDKGRAFNPLIDSHRSTLGADIESAEIGGLGVHLITQLTDQQHYQRDGERNILRIVKSMDADQADNST